MSDSVYEELAEKVKQFQNGDESAYDDLYRNGQRFVQTEVAKYLKSQDDIQEVTQKVFISVYRSLGTLKNPLTFVDWIRTIARNEALAFLKSSYKKHNVEWSSLSQSDEDGNENDYDPADENLSYQPQAVMDADSKRQILKEFLDTLPDNQRLCVSMYFFDDLSIKEIAEELSFPENTVKSNLRYAKIKLKDQIEAYSKKYDIKLYSVSPFALLLYLFNTQEADLVQEYADTVSSDAVTNGPRGNTKSSSSKNISNNSGNEPSATESRSGTGKVDTGSESRSPDVNLGGSSAGTSAEPAVGTGAGVPSPAGAAAAGGSAIVKIAIIGAVAATAAGGTVIPNRSRNDAGSSSVAESTEAPVSSESSAAKTQESLYTFTYDSSIAAGSDIDPTQSVAGKVILRVDTRQESDPVVDPTPSAKTSASGEKSSQLPKAAYPTKGKYYETLLPRDEAEEAITKGALSESAVGDTESKKYNSYSLEKDQQLAGPEQQQAADNAAAKAKAEAEAKAAADAAAKAQAEAAAKAEAEAAQAAAEAQQRAYEKAQAAAEAQQAAQAAAQAAKDQEIEAERKRICENSGGSYEHGACAYQQDDIEVVSAESAAPAETSSAAE